MITDLGVWLLRVVIVIRCGVPVSVSRAGVMWTVWGLRVWGFGCVCRFAVPFVVVFGAVWLWARFVLEDADGR